MSVLGDGGSVRTEGDSWEITESVGATALAVAAFRAVATGASDPLIRDPFAHLLVAPAGSAPYGLISSTSISMPLSVLGFGRW